MRLFNLLVHISRFLLNLYCPLSAAIFWLKHHGKKSNTTDKLEISWGDGDGDGDGASVVELRFSWIHLAAVSSHLSPESACRDSRNSQTSDIFSEIHIFHAQSCYTRIQHNEIHNLKCASVLKSNCIRNCRKCTITPADEFWKYTITPTNSEIKVSSRDPTYIKNSLFSDCLFKVHL